MAATVTARKRRSTKASTAIDSAQGGANNTIAERTLRALFSPRRDPVRIEGRLTDSPS